MTGPPPVELPSGEAFRQGYAALDGGVSVRVRIIGDGDRALLTVKADALDRSAGIGRTEIELPVSAADAEALWAHTTGRSLSKSRFTIALDGTEGLRAEIDRYDDALAGLWTVEVEFDSVDAAQRFVAPEWFGRDVTGDKRWSNASLARDGLPPE